MKKLIKMLAVISAAALMAGTFVSCGGKSAKELKPNAESDFKYTMTEDGAGVKITGYIGQSPEIIIPDTIEGLPVLEVEQLAELDHAFGEPYWNNIFDTWVQPKNNITITHISFPDSVRLTGDTGFMPVSLSLKNYDALEYIKFSAGMDSHPDKGGTYSAPVYSVATGKPVVVSSMPVLENCDKLTTVVIPEGVKVVPSFMDCKALKSITLPSTIEVIPDLCFYGCSGLQEIIIPETVSQITFDTKHYDFVSTNNAFEGTSLNLATQAKLKQLGYNGAF